MSLDFYCKNCEEELTAEKSMVGQKFSCPSCNIMVSVPQKSEVKRPGKVIVKNPEVSKIQAVFFLVVCILSFLVSGIYVLSLDPWAGNHLSTKIICYSTMGITFIISIFLIKTINVWGELERRQK